MIKKISLLVVLFACSVLAYQTPLIAYKEGGTDHIYFDGKLCRILTHPLNEFIAKHYAEWPFRPVNAYKGFVNTPMFTYFGPENGGGYTAFWSFQDTLLYLDSVKINACSRSLYSKSDNQRIVSVNIPPQEIVLNTSTENRTFKNQKNESLFANFVSDTIRFFCESYYSSYVKKGRVVSEPRKIKYDRVFMDGTGTKPVFRRNFKRMDTGLDSLNPKLYQEGNSPFIAYYKILDSLRQELDDKGMEEYLEDSRIDPRFKKFEDFFKINAISTWYYDPMHEADDRYVFYVSPKGKTPFKEFVFRLRRYETFEKDPLESIKLFLRTLIAIRKNPSFEKWLDYKCPFMNYQDIAIEREDLIDARVELASREKIWRDVGMNGEYVATIRYRDNDLPQYEFWLSDNGDVLVTFAFVPKMEEFFNIENFKIKRFGRTYSVEPRIERCEGFDSKKNSPREGYCNYLIIRHDGTIKYGPESGDK
jgi:hypothetical protein